MARTNRGRNEGTLFKQPNGTWRAQVSVEGKRLSKVCTTKTECQAWIKQTAGLVESGMSYQGSLIKLGEFLEEWLRMVKQNRRPKTHQSYRSLADRYILPAFGEYRLREMQPRLIEKYLTSLQEKKVGDRTCQIIYATLHAAFHSAVRKGIVGRNPLDGVEKPRVKHPRKMVTLQSEEVQRLLIAAEGQRDEALYFLAITSGLRQGELLGLKWTDIDWERGWLRVQRQVQRVDGVGLIFSEPKTQFGNRVVALGPVTIEKLREHRLRQVAERNADFSHWVEMDLIFPSAKGTPRDGCNLMKEFKELLQTAGMAHMRFHDLRHTSVTLVLNEIGASVKEAQHRAGHASPSTTINIYAGMATNKMDEVVASKLDELITPVKIELHTFAHDAKDLPMRKVS